MSAPPIIILCRPQLGENIGKVGRTNQKVPKACRPMRAESFVSLYSQMKASSEVSGSEWMMLAAALLRFAISVTATMTPAERKSLRR